MTKRSNVILITIDSLRLDHTSIFNYHRDTTPSLRLIARRGTYSLNHYANAPYTMASIYSIVYSTYPLTRRYEYFKPWNYLKLPDFISILRHKGYYSVLIHSNPWFKVYGFEKLFDLALDPYDKKLNKDPNNRNDSFLLNRIYATLQHYVSSIKVQYYMSLLIRKIFSDLFSKSINRKPYASGDEINYVLELILRKIVKLKNKIFLWIHYMDVHEPYMPSRTYYGKSLSPEEICYIHKLSIMKPHRVATHEHKALINLYDSCIRDVDLHIRHAYNILSSYLDLDKSLIVITSDHGEALGERGVYGHGGRGRKILLYNELLRVPLIILFNQKDYKIQNMRDTSSHVDLAPTVLDLLKNKGKVLFLGNSLLRRKAEDKGVLSQAIETYDPHDFSSPRNSIIVKQSYIHGYYKLIVDSNGNLELYNLQEDPFEQHNLLKRKNIDGVGSLANALLKRIIKENELSFKHALRATIKKIMMLHSKDTVK